MILGEMIVVGIGSVKIGRLGDGCFCCAKGVDFHNRGHVLVFLHGIGRAMMLIASLMALDGLRIGVSRAGG